MVYLFVLHVSEPYSNIDLALELKSRANYKSKFLNPIFSPLVSDWNVIKISCKLPLHSKILQRFPKFSEHFRTLVKTSENFQKWSEDRFENFPTFSDFFRRLPTVSKDFKNAERLF